MGWSDEQIKLRKERDDEILGDALDDIASVITGKSRADSLDDREKIKNSLDEILVLDKGRIIEDDNLKYIQEGTLK